LSWGWKKYLDKSRLDEALQLDGSLILKVEVRIIIYSEKIAMAWIVNVSASQVKGELPDGAGGLDLSGLYVQPLAESDCEESRKVLFSSDLADVSFKVYEAEHSEPTIVFAHSQILALRSGSIF
jgi:hypothetical protein